MTNSPDAMATNADNWLLNPIILIVDDQPNNIHVLSEHLERENFDIRVATSGQFALKITNKVKPHLILLDIRMPGMDGFQVCEALKANCATESIPIIFMSALDDVNSKIRGFELGAVDYITKPFEKNELIARVKNQIRISQLTQKLTATNASLDQKVQEKTQHIKRQEMLLRSTIDNTPIGIVNVNGDGKIMTVNRSFCEMLKYCQEELIAQHWLTLVAPEYKFQAQTFIDNSLTPLELSQKTEIGWLRQDKTICNTILAVGHIFDEQHQYLGFVLQVDDISQLQAFQKTLKIQERAINASRIGIIICDALNPTYPVIYANRGFEVISGYTETEVVGKNLKLLQGNDIQTETNEIIRNALNNAQECEVILRNYRKDGRLYYLKLNIFPVFDSFGKLTNFIGVQNDITIQKQAEDDLRASLKEKETLLKEIHHRVKNNLLVVSSLLSWQSETINDPKVLRIFEESQRRVYAMSLIHEQLYRSKTLSSINMQSYLSSLVYNIFSLTPDDDNQIQHHLSVADIALNVETSTLCGLITNELLLNALEHAFPRQHNDEAKISIDLAIVEYSEPQCYKLMVQDNGVGLPSGFNFRDTSSLGWQLVCLLTEQLEGDIQVTSPPGTTIELTFSELSYKPRLKN